MAVVLLAGCGSSASTARTPTDAGQTADSTLGRDLQSATDVATGAADATDLAPDANPDAPPANLVVADPSGQSINQLLLGADGNLYWIGGTHRIVRASASGSGAAATNIYTHPGTSDSTIAIGAIAVDDVSLYFSYSGDGVNADRGIYKLPLDGSAPPTKIAAAPQAFGLAVEGSDVCFTDGSDIRRVGKAGGAITTLVPGVATYRTTLVLNQGYVYFQVSFGAIDPENVYRWPIAVAAPDVPDGGGADAGGDAGATAPTIEKVSVVPGRLDILMANHVDQGFVYWASGDTVYRANGAGVATEVIAVANPLDPAGTGITGGLFPSAGTLYWVNSFGSSSQIYKAPADPNGTVAVVAYTYASSFAADATNLYAAVGRNVLRYPR